MKIIVPSVEIMRTGLEEEFMTPEQFIEKVGRTCYKSEDKITEDSAAKFVSGLIKRGHEAMIEHWNLIFETPFTFWAEMLSDCGELIRTCDNVVEDRLRPYLRFTNCMNADGNIRYLVSGNMRAWRDFIGEYCGTHGYIPVYLYGLVRNYPLFFPEYKDLLPAEIVNDILTPIEVKDLSYAERRIHQNVTMKFICDRGVSHEIVRHRVASFAQESTRYCNYGLNKFGGEITVIRPSWCEIGSKAYNTWLKGCDMAENHYFDLLIEGATPQQARSVLPNSLKTELIVTMNIDGWEHFFGLRCAPDAHPDMREVALMAEDLFDKEVNLAVIVLPED